MKFSFFFCGSGGVDCFLFLYQIVCFDVGYYWLLEYGMCVVEFVLLLVGEWFSDHFVVVCLVIVVFVCMYNDCVFLECCQMFVLYVVRIVGICGDCVLEQVCAICCVWFFVVNDGVIVYCLVCGDEL